MSKGKKVLLGILIGLAVIIVSVIIFGGILLSRIQYRSLEELSAEASSAEETVVPTPSGTLAPTPTANAEEEEAEEEIVIAQEMTQSELNQADQDAMAHEQGDEVINVLLVGVDRRSGDGDSRSDSIMIATLDQPNQRLKLTSLMRDMYVSIPGKSDNRINRSAAVGGVPLLMDTINQNFQMELEQYVMVDFYMFEEVIDQLDGITIDMSRGEVSEANDCIAGLNKQRGHSLRDGFITQRQGGEVTLTGKQALGYARMRKFGGGDYARTSRQAKVMQAVLDKFAEAGLVKQWQVFYEILPLVETNISAADLVKMVPKLLSVENKDIMHYRLPVEGTYKQRTIRGMWVLVPDIPANAKNLHWFLYDATEIDPLPDSDTQKGSYYKKVPKTATPPPEEYAVDEEGNVILDEDGNPVIAGESTLSPSAEDMTTATPNENEEEGEEGVTADSLLQELNDDEVGVAAKEGGIDDEVDVVLGPTKAPKTEEKHQDENAEVEGTGEN